MMQEEGIKYSICKTTTTKNKIIAAADEGCVV